MAGLLYREFVLNKKNLLCIAAGLAVTSLIMFAPFIAKGDLMETKILTDLLSVFVFLMLFLILGLMTASIFEADESKKWAYFITSTPLTDVSHVKEKYLFTLLLYVALFVWCDFLAVLSAALGGAANGMVAFIMLCVMITMNAVEFPFLVRFGSKAGSYVKNSITMLIILIVFEYIFFGDLSIFGGPEKLYELFEKLSDTALMSDISLVLLAVLPYFAAGLYFLSYKLSCKLYLKGAEEYER